MDIEPGIVGRDAELAVVGEFLEEARATPAILLLRGPAGIGKTTVWRAAVKLAQARSVRVLTAQPAEAESGLTFGGLIDLLGPVAEDVLPQLPKVPAAALSSALRRRAAAYSSADPVSVSLGVLGAVKLLAEERPVLLALDDAHWLDAASARALAYTVRRLRHEPVGVLCALRRGHALPAIEAQTERVLEIRPLPLTALDQVLRQRLGVAFLRPTLMRIERACGGNPLLAVELGRALLRRGIRFAPEQLPIPQDIGELLAERLRALSPDAMPIVLAAALLSSPTVRSVSDVLQGRADTRRALDEALRSRVLEVDGEAISFSHPLLSAVAFAMAGPSERQGVHRRAAEVVTDPEERARHLAEASSRGSERVARRLEEAAWSARHRGSPETAADLARLALRRTPTERADDARRRGIVAAGHLLAAGDHEAACGLLRDLLERWPSGAPRAEIMVELAHAVVVQGDRRRIAGEAATAAGDSAPRIEAEAILADLEWESLDDVRSGLEHARTALRLAERHADPERLANALAQVAWLESITTGVVRHDLLSRAEALHAEYRERTHGLWVEVVRGLVLSWAGDLPAARDAFEAARARALQAGTWDALPFILSELAIIELRAGVWPRALQLARDAEAASQQLDSPFAHGVARVVLAQVHAHLGEADAARQAAHAAEPLLQLGVELHLNRIQHILGFIELSLANAEAAHLLIGPAIERRLRAGVENPALLSGIPDDVEALVSLGRIDEADIVLRPFEQAAARLDHRGALATGRRSRGLLAAARGDTEDAIAILREALTVHDEVPEPFERARTLLVLGEVQRRGRRRGAAARSLREALETFEGLGAALWARRARQSLAKVDRTRAREGLTETDRRIIELVSSGRTNRQVAAELFMSRHTVDTHLRRIYQAVGVRNRAELASRSGAGLGTRPTSSSGSSG